MRGLFICFSGEAFFFILLFFFSAEFYLLMIRTISKFFFLLSSFTLCFELLCILMYIYIITKRNQSRTNNLINQRNTSLRSIRILGLLRLKFEMLLIKSHFVLKSVKKGHNFLIILLLFVDILHRINHVVFNLRYK